MDKSVCYCQVRVWTKIIGWIQIVEYLFLLLCLFTVIRTIDSLKLEDFRAVGLNVTEEQIGTIKPILFITYLVWIISGFRMGIVLLKGAYKVLTQAKYLGTKFPRYIQGFCAQKNNTKHLENWIKYIITYIVVDLVLTVIFAILTNGTGFPVHLCRFVVLQTWNAFCLLLVTARKDELTKEFKSNLSFGHEDPEL